MPITSGCRCGAVRYTTMKLSGVTEMESMPQSF